MKNCKRCKDLKARIKELRALIESIMWATNNGFKVTFSAEKEVKE